MGLSRTIQLSLIGKLKLLESSDKMVKSKWLNHFTISYKDFNNFNLLIRESLLTACFKHIFE